MTRSDRPDPFSLHGNQAEGYDDPPWMNPPDDDGAKRLGQSPLDFTIPDNRKPDTYDWGSSEVQISNPKPNVPPIVEKALDAALAIVVLSIGLGVAAVIFWLVWLVIF